MVNLKINVVQQDCTIWITLLIKSIYQTNKSNYPAVLRKLVGRVGRGGTRPYRSPRIPSSKLAAADLWQTELHSTVRLLLGDAPAQLHFLQVEVVWSGSSPKLRKHATHKNIPLCMHVPERRRDEHSHTLPSMKRKERELWRFCSTGILRFVDHNVLLSRLEQEVGISDSALNWFQVLSY